MARKPTKSKRVTGHGSRATKRATSDERRATLSDAAVREAGFDCVDLAAAAERLAVPDLADRLKRSRRLAAAWDRGRLLRRVRDIASTTYVVVESADKLLGLAKGEFASLYGKDRVIRELWERHRFDLLLATEQGFAAKVREGDPKAIAAVEHLFTARPAARDLDYEHLRPVDLAKATGILAQQWARWVTENGCPQAMDGTYSLPRVLDWLRKWERDKATGGRESAGLNPLQSEKARRERRENDEAEGRLVPIDVHLEALTARAHCLYGVVSQHRVKDIVGLLTGRTPEEQEQILGEQFARVLEAYTKLSPDIPVMDEVRARIEDALKMLMQEQ